MQLNNHTIMFISSLTPGPSIHKSFFQQFFENCFHGSDTQEQEKFLRTNSCLRGEQKQPVLAELMQFPREIHRKPRVLEPYFFSKSREMENEMFGISIPLLSQTALGMEASSPGVEQSLTVPTEALTTHSQPYYLTGSYPFFSTLQEAAINSLHPRDLFLSAPAPSIHGSFSASNTCTYGAEDDAEILAPGRWSLEEQIGQQMLQARFSSGSYGVPGNELSLTLGSRQQSGIEVAGVVDQCSEMSCSEITQICSHESRGPVQISQTVLASTYLHAANQVLAEITSHALEDPHKPQDHDYASGRGCSSLSSEEFRRNSPYEPKTLKTELISMLQMIDHGYDECVHRVQSAIATFKNATNLAPPHTPARFALHTVSALYKSLRDRISSQMQKFNRELALETESSLECSFLQRQWELQQLRSENQSWRPQRGLPEKSVAVLRSWMFQNFPKDNEKQLLAIKSGRHECFLRASGLELVHQRSRAPNLIFRVRRFRQLGLDKDF